jgi:hypothetical protein
VNSVRLVIVQTIMFLPRIGCMVASDFVWCVSLHFALSQRNLQMCLSGHTGNCRWAISSRFQRRGSPNWNVYVTSSLGKYVWVLSKIFGLQTNYFKRMGMHTFRQGGSYRSLGEASKVNLCGSSYDYSAVNLRSNVGFSKLTN